MRTSEADRRLSQYTRHAPQYDEYDSYDSRYDRGEARSSRPRNRDSYSSREPRQRGATQRRNMSSQSSPGVLGTIVGVLATIGTAIVNFFGWIGQLIPPLRRFSAPAVTAMAAVLVVAVLGVSFAIGHPGTSEVIEVTESSEASAASEEPSAPAASTVNPDEPADLVWRDTEFAVNPLYHTWNTKDNGRKVMYVTVDDGPSELTEKYLDVFDKYNVKATFFVTGHDPQYYGMIKEAYNRGHTIGLHSMTHEYSQIYSSEEAFYADLDQIGEVVKGQIGYVPCFIRFPGGSSNTISEDYSPGIMTKLINGVQARGYQYYDWSLASGDGETVSAEEIISISTGKAEGYDPTTETNIMYLCHDAPAKQTTLEALPKVLEYFQAAGYSFEAIDKSTWVCHHIVYPSEPASTQNQDEANADGENTEDTGEGEEEYQA